MLEAVCHKRRTAFFVIRCRDMGEVHQVIRSGLRRKVYGPSQQNDARIGREVLRPYQIDVAQMINARRGLKVRG